MGWGGRSVGQLLPQLKMSRQVLTGGLLEGEAMVVVDLYCWIFPESLRGPVPNRVFKSLYEFTIQHQRRLLLAFTDGLKYRPNIPTQLAPGTAKRSKLNSLSKQGFFFQPIQHTHYQHVIPRFTKQRGQVNQNQTNRLYLRHHWYHQFSSFIFIFSLVYIFTLPNHLDS